MAHWQQMAEPETASLHRSRRIMEFLLEACVLTASRNALHVGASRHPDVSGTSCAVIFSATWARAGLHRIPPGLLRHMRHILPHPLGIPKAQQRGAIPAVEAWECASTCCVFSGDPHRLGHLEDLRPQAGLAGCLRGPALGLERRGRYGNSELVAIFRMSLAALGLLILVSSLAFLLRNVACA